MSETPNTITGIKRELLMRLGHDADIFALISLCTREPYVVCDEETFDDEVFLFLDEEEAKKEAAKLAEEKVPVTVAKINGKDMLVLFTGLYTLGVNALVVTDKGDKRHCKAQIPGRYATGNCMGRKSGLTSDSCLSGTGNAPSGCICR